MKNNDQLIVELRLLFTNSIIINPNDRLSYAKYIAEQVRLDHKLPLSVFSKRDLVRLIPKDKHGYPRKYYKYIIGVLPILEYIYTTIYIKK